MPAARRRTQWGAFPPATNTNLIPADPLRHRMRTFSLLLLLLLPPSVSQAPRRAFKPSNDHCNSGNSSMCTSYSTSEYLVDCLPCPKGLYCPRWGCFCLLCIALGPNNPSIEIPNTCGSMRAPGAFICRPRPQVLI